MGCRVQPNMHPHYITILKVQQAFLNAFLNRKLFMNLTFNQDTQRYQNTKKKSTQLHSARIQPNRKMTQELKIIENNYILAITVKFCEDFGGPRFHCYTLALNKFFSSQQGVAM